jgi:MFS family permease
LIGAIGVGAVLANPIIVRTKKSPTQRRRLMAIGLFLAAPGMIVLAITPRHGMAIDLVGALMIGFGWEFVFISGQMTVVTEAAAGIRGRMMGLFFVLVTGTTAVGAVLLGLLINTVGITKAFLATSTMAAAAGVALLALGSRVTSPRNEATEPEGITSIQPN